MDHDPACCPAVCQLGCYDLRFTKLKVIGQVTQFITFLEKLLYLQRAFLSSRRVFKEIFGAADLVLNAGRSKTSVLQRRCFAEMSNSNCSLFIKLLLFWFVLSSQTLHKFCFFSTRSIQLVNLFQFS